MAENPRTLAVIDGSGKVHRLVRDPEEVARILGGAQKIHWGSHHDALSPRGLYDEQGGWNNNPFAKESLARDIFERLKSVYEIYTDPSYGDNPRPHVLVGDLQKSLDATFRAVKDEFAEFIRIQHGGV